MEIYQTNPQRKLFPKFRTLTLNIYKESFCVEIKIKKQKFFDEIINCIFKEFLAQAEFFFLLYFVFISSKERKFVCRIFTELEYFKVSIDFCRILLISLTLENKFV